MHKGLVGFAGPAGCGKTTSALLLKNIMEKETTAIRAIGLASFAGPMKDCLAALFRFTNAQLYTMEGKEKVDERYGVTPRVVMQRFGTEFIRSTVPDLWEILMEETIQGYIRAGIPLLIDDIRFDNESKLIRDYGGVVVHVQGRAEDRGSHESEQVLDIGPEDLVIDNSSILADLKGNLREMLT